MKTLMFRVLLPPALLLLTACHDNGTDGAPKITEAPIVDSPVTLSAVTARFPDFGADWNDYVSGTAITATDSACDSSNDTACVNGGEHRMIIVSGLSSCASVTAEDDLAAFTWVCDDSTSPVRLVSTLAPGKHMSDLIDFTTPGFKPNAVTVSVNGTPKASTSSSVWWFNPVEVNNVGGDLTSRWHIYLVTSNPAAVYNMHADHVALVIQPGVTLTGPATGVDGVISIWNDYVWFEGSIDASGDNIGVDMFSSAFSILRNVQTVNATNTGIRLRSSSHNALTGVTAMNSSNFGIDLNSTSGNNTLTGVTAKNNGNGIRITSGGNTLAQVAMSNNSSDGVIISGSGNALTGVKSINNAGNGISLSSSSTNNTLMGVIASNNNNNGINFSNTNNNAVIGVIANNNGREGILFTSGGINNIVKGATANNNARSGIFLSQTTVNTIFTEVAASNNTDAGISLGSPDNTFANVAIADNTTYGISIELFVATNNTFTGWLEVGNNGTSDCYVRYGGTNSGIDDGTCNNNGNSNATLSTSITLANSFAGMLYSDDTQNASDTGGAAMYPADPIVFDWLNFDNDYRAWGDGSGGVGQWMTGDGSIYDWSVSTDDTGNTSLARPALLGVLTLPTGNDTLTHTWSDLSISTFLINAVELPATGGNNNGLCESGETCLYTPNIGGYQGHGNLISAGDFTDGALTDITLMKYDTNGRAPEINPTP